jgi:hypothetical protein
LRNWPRKRDAVLLSWPWHGYWHKGKILCLFQGRRP